MLEEEVIHLSEESVALRGQLAVALARIAELEQSRKDPPSFVKPNRPKHPEPKPPRKKRTSHHNHSRRRVPPASSSMLLNAVPTVTISYEVKVSTSVVK